MATQNSKDKSAWWQPAIEVFVQVSGWIVFPLLVGIFLGQWLQGKWGHEPLIYLGCVAVAFIITNVGLIQIAVKTSKKMQKIIDETEKDKK